MFSTGPAPVQKILQAAALIARLSFEFARWCYDSGYIESKIVGPGGELSPNPVWLGGFLITSAGRDDDSNVGKQHVL